jgi:hypothetical protein
MLRNYVQETTNAPGTSASITLAGAPAGRVSFAAVFASGSKCFYGMDDGAQSEIGMGTLTTGSPNTFSRDTVLWNSAGTQPTKLNFTGVTKIFNDVPAERAVYADAVQKVALPGDVSVAGNTTFAGAAAVTGVLTVSASITIDGSLLAGGTRLIVKGGLATSTDGAQVQYLGAAYSVYTRVNQSTGKFEFVNSAYSSVTFAIQQSGGFTCPGNNLITYASGLNGVSIVDGSGTGSGAGITMQVNGSNTLFLALAYGGGFVGTVSTNGSSTSYNTTSDYRLKVVYGPATGIADLINGVPVHDAEMKFGGRRPMFLAHELQAALPDAVQGAKDAVDAAGNPILQVVDNPMLVPVLWAGLQEAYAQIAALGARIAALESAR